MIAANSADDHSTSSRNRSSPRKIVTKSLPVVNTVDALHSKIHRFEGRRRAYLKVQDGCDAFCTYCIIPRLRPEVRSKPIDLVVEEARGLVAAGFKEIVLTGIFLGAYGRETAIRKRFSTTRQPLADLIKALCRITGFDRLRLSSLEPGDVTAELLDVMESHSQCVPHLHLPLQSGSERILRKMNRQYTRDDFLRMIDRVKTVFTAPAISTDMIVGFPGETDDDFEVGLETAHQVEFCKIHAFPFSPREQTAAARWQREFVQTSVVKERMQRLGEVEEECSLAYRRRLVGTIERVIVEGGANHDTWAKGSVRRHRIDADENDESFYLSAKHQDFLKWGRADRFGEIHFESDSAIPGDLVDVQVDCVTPNRVYGSVVDKLVRPLRLPILPIGAIASKFALENS